MKTHISWIFLQGLYVHLSTTLSHEFCETQLFWLINFWSSVLKEVSIKFVDRRNRKTFCEQVNKDFTHEIKLNNNIYWWGKSTSTEPLYELCSFLTSSLIKLISWHSDQVNLLTLRSNSRKTSHYISNNLSCKILVMRTDKLISYLVLSQSSTKLSCLVYKEMYSSQ